MRRQPIRGSQPSTLEVFRVEAEGGSVGIRRVEAGDGVPQFIAYRNESTMYDLLDEEDRAGIVPVEDYRPVDTFDEALKQLESYPWHRLTPLHVSADFVETVISEVSRRGGHAEVTRWRERLQVQEPATAEPPITDGRSSYPDRKRRELSDEEKVQIRRRLVAGADTHALAREFRCALTQIAGIKAAMCRS